MPMNILYMIDKLGFGGTERQLVELIRNLDRSRFQPHICTLTVSNKLYDELDIPKISLDFKSFSSMSLLKQLVTFSRFIRENRIDIIQTFFQDPFLMAAIVKPFHRVKLIGSFRDLGFWRTPAETRKMRLAYPNFSGFIANSQAVKEHFSEIDGISPGKIEVIYNGFDCQHPDVQLSGKQSGGDPVVGIVANMNRKVKRVEDFVKAAALVYRQRADVRFVIVGDGELRGDLENLATSLGVRDVITFVGRVEHPMHFVKDFSIGVITSETEGFCNAIVEYMASGLPVVATNVGGNPELLVNGENGFLYSVGRPEELAEKLELLLDNSELGAKIGAVNREKILRKYSIAAMMEHHYRYYDSVMGGK